MMGRGKTEETLRVRATLSIFRLLLFLLGNPTGAYAEEIVRILGGRVRGAAN